MSILLILCVLAAAGWLVMSVTRRGPTDDPGDSVAAYSRAMAALDPGTDGPPSPREPATRRPPARRAQPRTAARRPRPAPHRASARGTSAASRRRPVRR